MSKALVIKGASFAVNKIETISILDPVPCTGISLSKSTVTFTEIGATETLTATVTPSNTTDSVTWESSDSNVATVANGVVTSTGIGTATITAYCGTHSASCSVSSVKVIDANSKFYLNAYEFSGVNMSLDPPKDYLGAYEANTRRIYGDTVNTLNGYKAYTGNNSSIGLDVVYPFAIPAGAHKINVSFPTAFTTYRVCLMDANSHRTYASVSEPGAQVKDITSSLNATNGTFEYIIPENTGANSFVFQLRTSSVAASSVTGDVTVTIS